MVFSFRTISFEEVEMMTGAGILWFPNLNEADPYLILPLASTFVNYFNMTRGITKENEHWFVNRFRSFIAVLFFCHLPFTCVWPAGAWVYWLSTGIAMAM